jgi:Transglutaminase-like superfamily
MSLLRRFLELQPLERRGTLEAALCLLAVRLAFDFLPLPRALRLLCITQGGRTASPVVASQADEVRRSIARAARHVPFRAACLQQAFAALLMLRRRGLSATVQLGLAKDGHGVLRAHAWSRCGEVAVSGVDAAQGFTAVAAFSV